MCSLPCVVGLGLVEEGTRNRKDTFLGSFVCDVKVFIVICEIAGGGEM